MAGTQVIIFLVAVGAAIVVWRSHVRPAASPHDVRLFERRYTRKGFRIVTIRRIGTEWGPGFGLKGGQPIRKYQLELEMPDGTRETRVRGVSRGISDQDRLWRYDRTGGRKEIL